MYIYTTKKCTEKVNISVHFPAILDHQKLGPYPVRGPVTANLQERNCFDTGEFWRGPQPFFGAKPFAPARFAVPGVSSLTALSRHDSHNSLPLCVPFGGGFDSSTHCRHVYSMTADTFLVWYLLDIFI